MAAITAAAITGGVALMGDAMSAQGAQATNAQQIAADELMQTRAFNFDYQQQQNAMAYNTQMSNTAMQRRMADLKAAGVNPLLAISQGGASSPQMSAVTGPGGSVGNLTNPQAAFGQLGAQAANAIQAYNSTNVAATQADANKAQARDTNAAAAIKESQAPWAGQSAMWAAAAANENAAKLHQEANQAALDYNINEATAPGKIAMLNNNYDFQQRMRDLELQMQRVNMDRARAGLPAMQNDAWFQNTWWGKYINPFIPSILQGTHAAAGAANAITNATAPDILPAGAKLLP